MWENIFSDISFTMAHHERLVRNKNSFSSGYSFKICIFAIQISKYLKNVHKGLRVILFKQMYDAIYKQISDTVTAFYKST